MAIGAGIAACCRDDPTPAVSNGLYPGGNGVAVSPTMIATVIHVAAAAGLGGVAGLLGGLFGVGGGFLVIPLLGFFYGLDQQTAQGTALIMVVPNVLWAFSRYQRRFGVDLRMTATIAGSALIAAYPTARFATGLDPHVLRLSFAVFLATTAGTVAYRTWRGGARSERGPRRGWGWVTIVGVIGGVVSGFFGVGGAFIAPPLLTTFFGLRQLEAQVSRWRSCPRAHSLRCWPMPGPVRSIGLSDCRSHLVGSRRSPLELRSPAACLRDGCGSHSAGSC